SPPLTTHVLHLALLLAACPRLDAYRGPPHSRHRDPRQRRPKMAAAVVGLSDPAPCRLDALALEMLEKPLARPQHLGPHARRHSRNQPAAAGADAILARRAFWPAAAQQRQHRRPLRATHEATGPTAAA